MFKVKLSSTYKSFIPLFALAFSSLALANTTLIHNVKGYTLDRNNDLQRFTQLKFKDDRIIEIGMALSEDGIDRKIDMQGKTMLPGIIDAHGHLLGLGENLTQVDLRDANDEADAVLKIKHFIGKKNNNGWVLGRGWNQVNWPSKQFPTKASLDKAFPDTPVYLSRVDGHAAWVNSAALKMAKIDASTVSPEGGEILKDNKGQPSGVLIDNAMYLVEKIIPKSSEQTLKVQLDTAQKHLLSLGITSMHDAGISKSVKEFYIKQAESKGLDVRVYAMLAATDEQIEDMLADGFYNDERGFLSIRSVKAYGDGALGSRGAALLEPYSDDPDNSGLLVTPQSELPELFTTVIGNGFQLNFHAIGDKANRLALQHFSKAFEKYPTNTERHRIEHAQVVAVEDIPMFKRLDIIPSMQPTHATSDKNMAEDRIGAERLKGAYAWQTFLRQGSKIAFGSDFPVELANPFHGLHAAVTRQDGMNQPKGGWIPEESVSLEQAFRGFTTDAAFAAFQEDMLGSLEVGKKADFIIIDRNLFEIEANEIRDTQVLQTWVDGRLRYSVED